MKHKRTLVDWQICLFKWHWGKETFPADEDGPMQQFVFVGPLQMRFYLWRIG